MEDNDQLAAKESERKSAIAQRLSGLSFAPVSTDFDLSRPDAVKLPFDGLPSLGVGFASMPEMFRTVAQTIESGAGEQLFRSVLPDGATLKQAKDGLFSSSAKLADGTAAWGKFQAVDAAKQTVTTTVPYDPTTLAMAVALAQINKKLDGIQKTLDEMFDYLLMKDKANIRASLETLASILGEYKFNWDNDQFKEAKYVLVQSINRDARQHIIELRARVFKAAEKKRLLEMRDKTRRAAGEALDLLKEYQLALYLYSFSSFLGVMLLENYDADYLESKASDIRRRALEYREAYTKCFDAIESRNRSAVDAVVLDGISSGAKGLGSLIERTPIGEAVHVDEALADAVSHLKGFNSQRSEDIVKRLTDAKDPEVLAFAESIESVNRVYNQPLQILVSEEAVYVLPESAV